MTIVESMRQQDQFTLKLVLTIVMDFLSFNSFLAAFLLACVVRLTFRSSKRYD